MCKLFDTRCVLHQLVRKKSWTKYINPLATNARRTTESKSSSAYKVSPSVIVPMQNREDLRSTFAPLKFRKGETERHTGAKLFDGMSIHDGMAKAHVEAEVILHLPYRTH
jgi:hypothetical protein